MSSRRNLLERLKPEFKKGFMNEANEEYRISIKTIEEFLSKNLFYDDLTIAEINRIWLFSSVPGNYDRSSKDWRYGEDMFELEKGCA